MTAPTSARRGSATARGRRHGPDATPGARYSRHARHGTGRGARDGPGRRPGAPPLDRGAAPRRPARHRPVGPRPLPSRRDRISPRRPPARGRIAHVHRRRRRARAAVRRARRPDRPARRRDRPVRRRGRHRRRADGLVHAHGRDPRDRSREPHRDDAAGRDQRDAEGGGRRAEPVLRAGPRVVRVVLDRRQPRHQRRRAVLREVRRDPGRGAGARGRDGGRRRPAARREEREGRRGLRADPAAGRQPGNAWA